MSHNSFRQGQRRYSPTEFSDWFPVAAETDRGTRHSDSSLAGTNLNRTRAAQLRVIRAVARNGKLGTSQLRTSARLVDTPAGSVVGGFFRRVDARSDFQIGLAAVTTRRQRARRHIAEAHAAALLFFRAHGRRPSIARRQRGDEDRVRRQRQLNCPHLADNRAVLDRERAARRFARRVDAGERDRALARGIDDRIHDFHLRAGGDCRAPRMQ